MVGISKWAVASLVCVLSGVIACSTNDSEGSGTVKPGPDRRTATVTPEAGGVLESADGRLVITIPPGAVPAPKELWVESVPTEKAELDFPDAIPKGLAYELGPEGQEFAIPASAELTLGLAEVPTSAKGLPAMALFSRSAAKGDEVLGSTGTVAPDGTPIDEPVVTITQDATAGVVRIGGGVRHFSTYWTSYFGNVWMRVEHTAKAVQKLGDVWYATVSVSNQGESTAIFKKVESFVPAGSCGVVEVVSHGSECPGKSSKCCEEFAGPQLNPAGTDILPGMGLTLEPPAQYRCATAGKALFTLSPSVRVKHPLFEYAVIDSFAVSPITCTDGKLTNGAACTLGSACSSGNCVDGVCCDTTCTGTCQACNLQGSAGKCTNVASGKSHPGTCPSPKVCNGNGACLLPNGQLCLNGASECQSGICRDMYCCDTACTGMCMQCDVPGSEGSCTNVPSGGIDPDGCFSPDNCDGNGACVKKAPAKNGTPCASAAECQSLFCVDGVCCNSKCDALCYSCSAAKKNSGPDGECGGTKSDTNPEGECPPTTVCGGGQCKPPQGYPCTTPLFVGAEKGGCGGYWACRDGVCCNNTFCAEGNTSCTACTQAKTGQPDGTCATVFAGTDPFNSCELPGALVCVGPTKPGTCM